MLRLHDQGHHHHCPTVATQWGRRVWLRLALESCPYVPHLITLVTIKPIRTVMEFESLQKLNWALSTATSMFTRSGRVWQPCTNRSGNIFPSRGRLRRHISMPIAKDNHVVQRWLFMLARCLPLTPSPNRETLHKTGMARYPMPPRKLTTSYNMFIKSKVSAFIRAW